MKLCLSSWIRQIRSESARSCSRRLTELCKKISSTHDSPDQGKFNDDTRLESKLHDHKEIGDEDQKLCTEVDAHTSWHSSTMCAKPGLSKGRGGIPGAP